MPSGFERILTTHTGSRPRPDDLASMILARDDGQVVEGLEPRVRSAVEEMVRRQGEVGIDIVTAASRAKSATPPTSRTG